MANDLPQLIEAIAAAAVPTGTGLVAYVRWRNKSVSDRDARSQIAINAAQQAAKAARAEEQVRTDQLLAEKQAAIDRLDLLLRDEQRQNVNLQMQNANLQRQLIDRASLGAGVGNDAGGNRSSGSSRG